MKIGQSVWAVVNIKTQEIVEHHEGIMIDPDRSFLVSQFKVWGKIINLTWDDVELVKVKIEK